VKTLDLPRVEKLLEERVPGARCILRPITHLQAPLLPEERLAAALLTPPKKAEFVAGRTAARMAMKKLGHPPRGIPKKESGEPLWPHGLVGSISHTKDLCLCVMGETQRFRSIGIDIENIRRMKKEIAHRVLTSSEKESLSNLPPPLFLQHATILFSAKEAYFKFYFSLTGRPARFHEFSFRLHPDKKRLVQLHPAPSSPVFNGIYEVLKEWVVVTVWEESVGDGCNNLLRNR